MFLINMHYFNEKIFKLLKYKTNKDLDSEILLTFFDLNVPVSKKQSDLSLKGGAICTLISGPES